MRDTPIPLGSHWSQWLSRLSVCCAQSRRGCERLLCSVPVFTQLAAHSHSNCGTLTVPTLGTISTQSLLPALWQPASQPNSQPDARKACNHYSKKQISDLLHLNLPFTFCLSCDSQVSRNLPVDDWFTVYQNPLWAETT